MLSDHRQIFVIEYHHLFMSLVEVDAVESWASCRLLSFDHHCHISDPIYVILVIDVLVLQLLWLLMLN